MIIERRQISVKTVPQAVYQAFCGLGGERGWLFIDWTWRIRGIFDRLIGGVGFHRGRRHPSEVRIGDAIDFWRVESMEQNYKLRLRAEMKVPGRAWLQFEVSPDGFERSLLVQTAFFAPRGLFGLLYWYLLYPIHSLIFSGLIKALSYEAIKIAKSGISGRDHGYDHSLVRVPIENRSRT